MRFKIAMRKKVGGRTADERQILRIRGSLKFKGVLYFDIKREKSALEFVIPFLQATRKRYDLIYRINYTRYQVCLMQMKFKN